MKTTEEPAVQERMILHRNPEHETITAKQIDTQHANVQQAVNAFNEIGLQSLRPDELNYFLQGGQVWIEERWKSEQEIPKGWPKGINRDRFIEILDRPDFSAAVTALSKVTVLHQDLFYLEGSKVLINAETRDTLINSHTIYLDADEQSRLTKLETLFELLGEFGMLQRGYDSKIASVDLNAIGYAFNRFPEETGKQFDVNPHMLKQFLSSELNPHNGFRSVFNNQTTTPVKRRMVDVLREMRKSG